MHRKHLVAGLAAALVGLAPPAWSYGQIDWLQASATQVQAGGTLSFGVGWSMQGSFQNGGGSNLDEPSPVEGYNEWQLNWYWTESITPQAISVSVSGPTLLTFDEPVSATPGSGASGSFGFQMQFDTPGIYLISASGSYSVLQTSTQEAEVGTRYCYNNGDPESGVYLSCDAWSYSYPFQTSESSIGGSLNSASVQIEVSAVPAPATAALWLGGLALLGLGRRRWRGV